MRWKIVILFIICLSSHSLSWLADWLAHRGRLLRCNGSQRQPICLSVRRRWLCMLGARALFFRYIQPSARIAQLCHRARLSRFNPKITTSSSRREIMSHSNEMSSSSSGGSSSSSSSNTYSPTSAGYFSLALALAPPTHCESANASVGGRRRSAQKRSCSVLSLIFLPIKRSPIVVIYICCHIVVVVVPVETKLSGSLNIRDKNEREKVK